MALTIPKPTANQITEGLLAKVVADAVAVDSLIQATLSPYGITLDATTASDTDASELRNLKIGSRGNLPPGLSLFLFPARKTTAGKFGPNGYESERTVHIQGYWEDPPDGTPPALTKTPRLLWAMFPAFCEALEIVLGPENLSATNGGWDVTGSGDFIMGPLVRTSTPCAWMFTSSVKRDTVCYFCDLIWSGKVYAVRS